MKHVTIKQHLLDELHFTTNVTYQMYDEGEISLDLACERCRVMCEYFKNVMGVLNDEDSN